jgi:hypothetical protein
MTTETKAIEERVAHLEALAQALKDDFLGAESVQASAFLVMGSNGVAASLAAEEGGGVSLRQMDQNGNPRLVAAVQPDGNPHVVMADAAGEVRLALSLESDGSPLIRLMDAKGTARLDALVGPSGAPQLTLFDAERRPRLLIMLSEDGEPVIVRLDENGNGIR